MAITKTSFINYGRCKRYVSLSEVKKDKLNADISYEEYKSEELDEEIKNLLSEMYSDNDEDLIDTSNPELEVMLPYYKEIEMLAGSKIKNMFGGEVVYALDTKKQQSFDFKEDGIRYLCYVDIYNEIDSEINIIEVKATTSNKYLSLEGGYKSTKNNNCSKYSIFYKDERGIYHLKEDLKNFDITKEMPNNSYLKKRSKLLDRFDECGKYIYDLSVQRMIIEGDLKEHNFTNKKINYYLAVLNSEYVFDGKYENNRPVYGDDIISIFEFNNITKQMQEKVLFDKENIKKYLLEMDISPCNLGSCCCYKSKSKCKFCPICFKKIPKYNSSLSYMNNGVLNLKSLKEVNLSRQSIYNFIKRNNMEKVGPGIYISKETLEDEAYVLSLRCPKGVVSHDDALYYYGLVDREPMIHNITMYSGYNPTTLTRAGYKVYTVKRELLDLGKKTVVNQFGHEIPMYDLERTVCDLVRNRSNFEIQDFNAALKSYVKRKDKDLNRLMFYAKTFRLEKIIKQYMEILL
mgnify:CR=1 FL=1